MKKNYALFLIIIIVTVGIAGCKKDKNENSSIPKEIIGKWRQVKRTYTKFNNGQQESSYVQAIELTGYDEYFSNGTMIFSPDQAKYGVYNYNVKDEALVITNKRGQPVTSELLIELTSTKLILRSRGFDILNSALTEDVDYEYLKVK
ncbi:MAG: hypothetical protein V4520_18055 [Bacteroidota bacterium]